MKDPSKRLETVRAALFGGVAFVFVACGVAESLVVEGGDFAGAKADAYCDRRYVVDGAQRAAFCQEIVDTVAASQFADDCRTKHRASAGAGACPREHIVAGCKLLEKHEDGSQVFDWYYDVTDILVEAGPNDGPEGGPTFDSRPTSVDAVAAMCADPLRYEHGAELVMP